MRQAGGGRGEERGGDGKGVSRFGWGWGFEGLCVAIEQIEIELAE